MIKLFFARILCFLTVIILLTNFLYPTNNSFGLLQKVNNQQENTFSKKADNYLVLNIENEEVKEIEEFENKNDVNKNAFSNFIFVSNNDTFVLKKIEFNSKLSTQFFSQNKSSATSKAWMESIQILI